MPPYFHNIILQIMISNIVYKLFRLKVNFFNMYIALPFF